MSAATFNRDVLGELFTMLCAGMTVVVMWVGFRLPGFGMEILMGTLFMSSILFYFSDAEERTKQILLAFFAMGGVQSVVSMLLAQKFLLLFYLTGATFLLTRYYPDRRVAVMIVGISCLSMVLPKGFESGMNRWIAFLLQSPFVVVYTMLARKLFPPVNSPETVLSSPGTFAAFQFAVMIAIGVFLYRFFQLPYGDWLVYTIVLVHSGGVFGSVAVKRAAARFWVAPPGLLIAFLFAALTVWFDYRLAYGVIFFAAAGFFISRCYRNFVWFSLIFMVFFILMYDLGIAWNNADFSMLDLFFSRLFNIGLGMAVSILAEPSDSELPAVFSSAVGKKG